MTTTPTRLDQARKMRDQRQKDNQAIVDRINGLPAQHEELPESERVNNPNERD